ncbi:MAG TPA: tannase/feruloyl esterase family alpha/beta hydrolase [Gemmatimonadaceae bacterium]|jgi:feruloyl esterase
MPERSHAHLGLTLAAMLFAAAPIRAQAPATVTAPGGACAALRSLRLPDVRLTEVVDAPDPLDHGDLARTPHCRVTGVISKEILFVVTLPDKWNQRLLMGGNGGFAGSINRDVARNATYGYVTVSTNTGHADPADGAGAKWALNNPERQINYAFLGVHRTVEVAKVLTKAFYGAEPRYSYFDGCSNGGRQALMEVERYPEDFDGVVAGAPAIPFTNIFASFARNVRAAYPTPAYFAKPLVTQANLDLLAARVLDACDALDGVKDGVLGDPRDCRFKLSSLPACPDDKAAASCLTRAQRHAIETIYSPLTDAEGNVIYPGQPLGGENLRGGWAVWIAGSDSVIVHDFHYPSLQPFFAIEGARYLVFNDPSWDYTQSHADLYKEGRRISPMYGADDPNISKFGARKAKLILWHGWADPALNPLETIRYYEQVLAKNANARDYVRLFMEPGVLHCAGGNGPSNVAWLATIAKWVENGVAPEQVVATKQNSTGQVVLARPLCAYPKRAVYNGSGSPDEANSFACRDP